uniref:Uncharacterized protein n=1 Tax=Romanomermis culicivorax TaxID=13658 RepID=A0A915HGV8_ROMCU
MYPSGNVRPVLTISFEVKGVFGWSQYDWFQAQHGDILRLAGRGEGIDDDNLFDYAGRVGEDKRTNEVGLNFVMKSG